MAPRVHKTVHFCCIHRNHDTQHIHICILEQIFSVHSTVVGYAEWNCALPEDTTWNCAYSLNMLKGTITFKYMRLALSQFHCRIQNYLWNKFSVWIRGLGGFFWWKKLLVSVPCNGIMQRHCQGLPISTVCIWKKLAAPLPMDNTRPPTSKRFTVAEGSPGPLTALSLLHGPIRIDWNAEKC